LADQGRTIWVDAICINQQDIPEKNQQVSQMQDIYVGSTQVVVWLGEEGDAKLALELLQQFEKDKYELLGIENYGINKQAAWDAGYELFYQRPWWTRIWILQEVLHKNPVLVHIGALTIQLENLCDKFGPFVVQYNAIGHDLAKASSLTGINTQPKGQSAILRLYNLLKRTWTHSPPAREQKISERLQVYSQMLHAGQAFLDPPSMILSHRNSISMGESSQLTSLLMESRAQRASDARDKIFALLGMAKDASSLSINIDYNSSKRHVYVTTTRELLRISLEPLLMVESQDRPVSLTQDWPS
jgi:hypothetical protein